MSESFWKKDISFKKKPAAAADEAPGVDPVPAEAKQSFLKKEISFKKKEKTPKTEGYEIRVPKGSGAQVATALGGAATSDAGSKLAN